MSEPRIILQILSKAGHQAEAVANGAEAVRALATRTFDLVLMDVQMPEMDGLAATAAIRQLDAELRRRTPVVALTANSMAGDREACLGAGMDDYISKPVSKDEILRKVSEWIACADPRGEGQAAGRWSGSACRKLGVLRFAAARSRAASSSRITWQRSVRGPVCVYCARKRNRIGITCFGIVFSSVTMSGPPTIQL